MSPCVSTSLSAGRLEDGWRLYTSVRQARPRLLSECKSGNLAAGWHEHTSELLFKKHK